MDRYGSLWLTASSRPWILLQGSVDPRAAVSAEDKIRIYSEALARLLPQPVPVAAALSQAGNREPECRELRASSVDVDAPPCRGSRRSREARAGCART